MMNIHKQISHRDPKDSKLISKVHRALHFLPTDIETQILKIPESRCVILVFSFLAIILNW